MGDFSRNPTDRLTEATKKHYVGVRMQQGVPLLDADWNELEDLRRHELATLFGQYIGDGVPGENDGFRAEALDNGGVGTIVLRATALAATGRSSVAIDFGLSTAASLLGFKPGMAAAERSGATARITGDATELFGLANGQTLAVQVNEAAAEVVIFAAGDFLDITKATLAEALAALNAGLTQTTAFAGTGNDFVIRGGDGTVTGAGRLLVDGQEVLNETDTTYTSQPLFQNHLLADAWGVPVVPALTAPVGDDRTDVIYLDSWEREVDAQEDDAFVLPEVGVEATVRLRREWVVRVAEGAADLSGIATQPGHRYVALSRLERTVSDGDALPTHSFFDLRKRQLTLADVVISPILVRDDFGLDHVNSGLFAQMLTTTTSVYRDLLDSDFFLAANFNDITTLESMSVLRAFQDVRFLAESGITDTVLERLNNDAALDFFGRLYAVQRAFVDSLLVIAGATAQRIPTQELLQALDVWLEGNGADIPGLRPSVMADESPSLGEAYDAQIFINSELGRSSGVLPRGVLDVQFVSGPAGVINANTVHAFTYTLASLLNAEDTLTLALTDTEEVFDFAFDGLPEDPNNPGDASRARVTLEEGAVLLIPFNLIVPAAVPVGTRSRIVLVATSIVNPDEIDFANVEILVEVGAAIILPSNEVGLSLLSPAINLATDVVEIGPQSEGTDVTFTVEATNSAATDEFRFSVDFIGQPDSYDVVNDSVLNPADIPGGTTVAVNITVEATALATAEEDESLMVIRLSRTADGAFQELPVRVIPNVA